MRIVSPKSLYKAGILGMNRRNVTYIAGHNPRALYPRVDDKLQTKILAEKAGIATPKLLSVVRYQHQVKVLDETLAPHEQFVIKPAHGSAGKGILVILGMKDGKYLKPGGEELTALDVKRHASNILSGLYSLGGRPDVAMVEALVNFADTFEGFTFEGVPDIRTIIFKGFPVMAMTRLSTSQSDGKANLHQGAVGVGLDIATGRALNAVQKGKPITHHPDTGRKLSEIVIPHWDVLLRLAAECYEVTDLGYLGADVVLDKELGPLILELNARPGLAIQVANGAGLAPRLKLIEEMDKKGMNVDERVAFSVENFIG